jgi:hypothetical protein
VRAVAQLTRGRCCSTPAALAKTTGCLSSGIVVFFVIHRCCCCCCRRCQIVTISSSESALTISSSDMGEGAAATVRKAKWGRSQVALKLFRGEPEQIYKELTAEAAILHVSC